METSVFIFLVVSAAVADAAERPALAALAAGLATLTRPEGLIVGALVLGRHVLAGRLPPRRAVFAYALTLLPWVAFAVWWFGSPLPQSMLAKTVAYRDAPLGNAGWIALQPGAPFVFVALVTLASVPAGLKYLRRRPNLWALAAFAPALIAGYVLAGFHGVRIFSWYTVPLVPFYAVAMVAAYRAMTKRLHPPWPCWPG